MMALSSENSGFRFETLDEHGITVIRLGGQVTEDAPLAEVFATGQSQNVIIDTSGIQRINSCGVRDWVVWIKSLEERQNSLYFVRCSPVVVAQLNMISNFTGKGQVVSILAPYLCPACNQEHQKRLSTMDIRRNFAAPEVICPSCGAEMEFDEIPESYFEFSRLHDKALPSGVVEAVLKRVDGGT